MKLRVLKENLVDYRRLRPSNLNTPEFRHLWYLIFWPIFGILFQILEQVWVERDWIVVYHPLDDVIPFCELFVIPYMWWFVFLAGMVVFTLFFDPRAFEGMMKFIILTYGITLIIYIIFPTMQELRPPAFERDNFLTRFMADFYEFDTNTNVCPSMHVSGAVAAMVTSWNSKFFRKVSWQIYFTVATVLICMSTVFLKQHSVVDILPSLILCAIAYPISFPRSKFKKVKVG
ncbi:MAG: phosphatase PAP2 family protein [Clostridia bacterium]|nr:phosphatase PAP2 family protein [Clostridia bacterium]